MQTIPCDHVSYLGDSITASSVSTKQESVHTIIIQAVLLLVDLVEF